MLCSMVNTVNKNKGKISILFLMALMFIQPVDEIYF